jgi:hypothetical protein
MAGEFVHREDSKKLRKRKVMVVTWNAELKRLNSGNYQPKMAKIWYFGGV